MNNFLRAVAMGVIFTLISVKGAMAVNVEPSAQKFLDALAEVGGPPIYTVSPKDARPIRFAERAKANKAAAATSNTRASDTAGQTSGESVPIALANAGLGPAGTASSAGDQLQPRRRMEGTHQQVHRGHSAQR